ncbi:MAG TPA: diguanylate cyclase [Thermomicrobiales bacterium]|nr:diguanylate cyclase [Thermomicrobiales bacterium]
MAAGTRRPSAQFDDDPAEWPFVQPSGDRLPWEEDAQLRSAFDDAAIGMSIANLNWGLLRVNAAHCRMLGYTAHELLTTDFRTRIHPDDLAPNDDLRRDVLSGKIDFYETERRYIHRDGHVVWCLVTVSLIRDAAGDPQYFVGQMQDITERKQAEESLRLSEQRMSRVLASASDGMLIADQHGILTTVNPAAEKITGLVASALVGQPVRDLPRLVRHDGGASFEVIGPAIERALTAGEAFQGLDIWFTRHDDTTIYGIVDIVPLRRNDTEQDGILLTLHDVTERTLLEQRLAQLALHDALTGLPNRRLFEDRAEQALATAQRAGCSVGVLLIDLDNFKPVNDRFGHPAGDGVLIEVARRLSACVRDGDTVARFGGDEFVVLLQTVDNRDDVRDVRDRLVRALEQPHLIAGQKVTVTASIGTSLMTSADDRFSDLLHHADSNMYAVKRKRRPEPVRTSKPWSLFKTA